MLKITKSMIGLIIALLIFSLVACSPATGSPAQPGNETSAPSGSSATAAPLPSDSQPVPPDDSGADTDLLDTRWKLASITENGTDSSVPDSLKLTLEFQTEGLAAGSGGCNSFGGQYAVQGDHLTFSQIVSTMMACTDANVMQLEQRYLRALNSSGAFELADQSLTIRFDDGTGALHFVPQDMAVTPTAGADQLCALEQADQPDWQTCRSPLYGFKLQFPTAGTLMNESAASTRIDLPVAPGTNLVEKYLQIDVRQNVSPCWSPMAEGYAPGDVSRQPVQVNEIEFIHEKRIGVATGNIYTWEAYSTNQGDLCLSLSFVLHSFDPQLVATPPPEYDPAAESAVLTQILSTFAWLTSDGAPAKPSAPQATPTPQRIDFAPGGTSATETGHLTASGSALYVLRALAGQQMLAELSFNQGQAVLAVWGEDGTLLLSDHAQAIRFDGQLPSTQDYFIQVEGYPDGPSEYNLHVTIPPA